MNRVRFVRMVALMIAIMGISAVTAEAGLFHRCRTRCCDSSCCRTSCCSYRCRPFRCRRACCRTNCCNSCCSTGCASNGCGSTGCGGAMMMPTEAGTVIEGSVIESPSDVPSEAPAADEAVPPAPSEDNGADA